jgi:monoamine oxidase
MSRSLLFDRLARSVRIALHAKANRLSSGAALSLAREAEERRRRGRRDFIKGGVAASALAATGLRHAAAAPPPNVSVGIVGAGLAGLACADRLRRAGVTATLYEASSRVGGRCFSLGGAFPGPVTFPGQVAERGGEFIDNLHKTMLGYAQEFDLAREDLSQEPGEVSYFFDGTHHPESAVVDEFRDFVDAMRDDLRTLSNAPDANTHTAADVALDNLSLAAYLDTRGAGPLIRQVVESAYLAEYGLEIDEQSCLDFLLFIHADRRSKFTPFGVFSDERYHLVGGNQQIAERLRARLPGQVRFDRRLLKVARASDGRVVLTFAAGSQTVTATHDRVVLAIPFTVLRRVTLDATLALPAWKRAAIDRLGYGTNAKMMVGFGARPWIAQGSNGSSYSDLPNHQATWETNPALATSARAVLTDYSGGDRGARLDPTRLQTEATRFLGDLDRVYPGALAAATRDAQGRFRAHLEHWPSNPLTLGSYTCYRPGQFTTLAGNEATRVGNVLFAGEHTNSFYEFQGFMEGAALSGIAAAQEILRDF